MLHTKIPGTIQLQEPSLWNKLCGRWNDRQNDKEQLIKTKILKQQELVVPLLLVNSQIEKHFHEQW